MVNASFYWYAKCLYANCPYAECRCALFSSGKWNGKLTKRPITLEAKQLFKTFVIKWQFCQKSRLKLRRKATDIFHQLSGFSLQSVFWGLFTHAILQSDFEFQCDLDRNNCAENVFVLFLIKNYSEIHCLP